MKTRTSKKSILIRTLFIAPLLAILLYGFSTTVQIPKKPAPVIVLQEGATKKQIGEYNTLVKKYNEMLAANGNIRIKKSDVDRLEYLHGIMTQEQRADAEPFPDFPEPPQPPTPPSPPDYGEVEVEVDERIVEEIIESQEIYDDLTMDEKTIRKIIENQNIYDSDSKGPGYFSLKDEDVTIYLNGKEISYFEMMRLEKEGTITSMDVIKKQNGKSVISIIDLNKSNLQPPPVPPIPPKPKSPIDYIKDMAKQDALFYYEGKEISSDKAIEIMKNNDEINIDTKRNNNEKPKVRLSMAPIETEN